MAAKRILTIFVCLCMLFYTSQSQEDQSQGGQSQGGKSQGDQSQGDQSQGDQSQGGKSQGDQSQGDQSQAEPIECKSVRAADVCLSAGVPPQKEIEKLTEKLCRCQIKEPICKDDTEKNNTAQMQGQSQNGQWQQGQYRVDGGGIVLSLLKERPIYFLGNFLQKLPCGLLGKIVQCLPNDALNKLIHAFSKDILAHIVKGFPNKELKKILKTLKLGFFSPEDVKNLTDTALGQTVGGLEGAKLPNAIKNTTPEALGRVLKTQIPKCELAKRVTALNGSTVLYVLQCGDGARVITSLFGEICDCDLGQFFKKIPNRLLGYLVLGVPARIIANIIETLPKAVLGALVRGIPQENLRQIFRALRLPQLLLKPALGLSNESLGKVVKALPKIGLALQIKKLNPELFGYLLKTKISCYELGKQVKGIPGSIILPLLQGKRYKDSTNSERECRYALLKVLKEVGLLAAVGLTTDGIIQAIISGRLRDLLDPEQGLLGLLLDGCGGLVPPVLETLLGGVVPPLLKNLLDSNGGLVDGVVKSVVGSNSSGGLVGGVVNSLVGSSSSGLGLL